MFVLLRVEPRRVSQRVPSRGTAAEPNLALTAFPGKVAAPSAGAITAESDFGARIGADGYSRSVEDVSIAHVLAALDRAEREFVPKGRGRASA